MKEKLNFKEHKINPKQTLKAETLNEILENYDKNLLYLYHNFKTTLYELKNFKNVLFNNLDWYVINSSALASSNDSKYTISGYSALFNNTLNQDKLFGSIYLKPIQFRSKIDRYLDNGIEKATDDNIISVSKVTLNDTNIESSTVIADLTINKVIDNKNNIWQLETDSEYVAITLRTSTQGINTNIIDVYPFTGTELVFVKADDTYKVNTKFPSKILLNNMVETITFVFKGVSQGNNKYLFSVRYIDVFYSLFSSTGEFSYNIGSMNQINSISFNSDYIKEELKVNNTFKITILNSGDPLGEPIYDSDRDPFPIQSQISTNTSEDLIFKMSLNNTEGYSPIIKWITIQ